MPLLLHTSWWSVSTLFGGYFFSLHTRWWSPQILSFSSSLDSFQGVKSGGFHSRRFRHAYFTGTAPALLITSEASLEVM